MIARRPTHRLPAALLAAAAVLGLSLAVATGPAGAHGGDGQMELVSAVRGDGDAVDLTVRLTYVEDGHGVPDATVTAVVGDAAAVPLAAAGDEGDYAGTVDAAPGATIRVTSVEPVVTLDVAAPDATTTTTAATTTTDPTTTGSSTTTEATTTTEAATTTAPTPPQQGGAVIVDDDDGLSTGVILAIGAGVVAVAGAGIFAAYKMGQDKGADEPVDPDAPEGDGPGGPGATPSP